MVTFRLRARPKKPVRKTEVHEEYTIGCCYVQDLVDWCESRGISLSDAEVTVIDKGFYESWYTVQVAGTRYETEEEFKTRIQVYEKKLEAYEEWYDKNKATLKVEVARRVKKSAQAEEKRQAKAKKALKKAQKEVKRLEKIVKD